MINLKIKKIFLILITITLSLSLVSCKTDFSKYSGIYVMTTYELEEKDPDEQVDYDFDVIKKYNIELKENGYAVHTLFLGVMDEEVAFSNHYDVLEKKGEIHFYIKQGLAVTNKEEWDFIDTYMRVGNAGLYIGEKNGSTAVRITTDRIDFLDGYDINNPKDDNIVAHITGQLLKIDRGIFVKSATIGEHKIETIDGGHTIWQWMG